MESEERLTITEATGATFVGREQELQELVAALDASGGGRGRLVLLAGEPGIGKSRLADELAAHARERGTLVLRGRCWEDAGAPPFWSWIQVLRACLRPREPEAGRALIGGGLRDLAQILPELRGPDDPEEPATSESARFQQQGTVHDSHDDEVERLRRGKA